MKSILLVLIVLSYSTLGSAQSEMIQIVDQLSKDLESISSSSNVICNPKSKFRESLLLNPSGSSFPISVLSFEEVERIFKVIINDKSIPFAYSKDGCYARAYKMATILDRAGVISGKVFLEGSLKVTTNNPLMGDVYWKYHVASIVKVMTRGVEEVIVLDPSIFNRPVKLNEWVTMQVSQYENAAEIPSPYFTKRYNFYPRDKNLDLDSYDSTQVNNSLEDLEEYLCIEKELFKAKE